MISRLAGSSSRPVGIAFEQGGFTDQFVNDGEGYLHLTQFKPIGNLEYWSTISPAAFAYANASGQDASGEFVGTNGVYLDTERDTAVSPDDVIFTTAGIPPSAGPYNVSPAWGVAAEVVLQPGQTSSLMLDNAKIWGDGSTQTLILPSGASWTHSN